MAEFEDLISVRPFQPKDYDKCRMIFTASTMEMIPNITRIAFYKCLPYTLALLCLVAGVRWSVLDVMVYLGVSVILSAIFYKLK